MTKFFTLCLMLIGCMVAKAQLYEVSMDEKVNRSSLIVEGEVIDQYSFWNPSHTLIYTSNKVRLTKIFKGNVTENFIEVLTQGGNVGSEILHVTDVLELQKGETGIFICHPNELNLRNASGKLIYDIYASSQGFIKYDEYKNIASTPFKHYTSITESLYPELKAKTGAAAKIIDASYKLPLVRNVAARPNAPVITSFSPAVVNAGKTLDPATNLLTITGSGFGAPGGVAAIRFDDCNNGTGGTTFDVPYTSNLVALWTDGQIQVRVPDRAGTGFFSVRDANGNEFSSTNLLEVNYSIITSNISGVTKQLNLINDNGLGGYTASFTTSTAGSGRDLSPGSPDRAPIERAITTWKEVVGWNVTYATTTQQNIALDGTNIIIFDNSNAGVTVPAGVLASCYIWANSCNGTVDQYQRIEFDVIIRNNGYTPSTGGSFTSGPCPPNASQLDLETVLLHEFGHAINLSHVNDGSEGTGAGLNPAKLMHYAVQNRAKRTSPDQSAYDGALYCVRPKGITFSCPTTEHIQTTVVSIANDNCPVTFPSTSLQGGTTVPFDLVHATSNRFGDPAFTQVTESGSTVSVTNTQYYAFRTDGTGNLNINVSGFATVPTPLVDPVTLTSCFNSGVEISVYQTGICPVGQSFPTPIAYRTFTGDGSLAQITGLAANTPYLLMADGIFNTKATFNLTFTGTALPIKLTSFTGEVLKDANLLKWKAESIVNVAKIEIEKSNNNTSFTAITQITGAAVNTLNGSYKDNSPFTGNNYYRLKITDVDGKVEYTNIVLLKRADKVLITLSPNPVKNVLNIKVSASDAVAYSFKLINATGQTVLSKQLNVTAGNQNYPVIVNTFAKGAYHAVVYAKNGEVIKNQVIVVE